MVHRNAAIAGDDHDAVLHRLVIEGDRGGADGHVRLAEGACDRVLQLLFQGGEAIERHCPRHRDRHLDEIAMADRADAQPVKPHDAGNREHDIPHRLRHALRGGVYQRFDGTAAQAHAEPGDDHGDRERRRRIAPGVAGAGEREPDDHRDRPVEIRGKMQRVGFERRALGLARGFPQHMRAPAVHHHFDAEHGKGDKRKGRRRAALHEPLHRFHRDAAGEQEQQRGRRERGDAFHLAVAVMMLFVGGTIGDAHRVPGDERRAEIDQAVQGVRNQGEAADRHADHEFRDREQSAGEGGNRGDFFFLARHESASLVRGSETMSPAGAVIAPAQLIRIDAGFPPRAPVTIRPRPRQPNRACAKR